MLFLSCARYPKSGEYCYPNFEVNDCVFLDFKSGKIGINQENSGLIRITDAKYEFNFRNEKFSLSVLNENRLEIKTIRTSGAPETPSKVYLVKKEDKAIQRKRFSEFFKRIVTGKN